MADGDCFYIEGEPQYVMESRIRIIREFEDLQFKEDGHRYFLHGEELQSASGIGKRFIEFPFNEQEQAERYAKRHGETPGHWIRQWRCNSFRATTLGTRTHEFAESLSYCMAGHPELIRPNVLPQYDCGLGYLAPITSTEEAAEHFLKELGPSYHLVLNEARVYSGKNPVPERNLKERICGTFDMLYWYDGKDGKGSPGFVIMDYKTNSSLENRYNREHMRKLLDPFSDMIEEDLNLYTIQLSLYALMLEDIGIGIVSRRIIWLCNDGTYQVIPVHDVSDRLRKVL